jgi:glutathione S-transferase
MPLRLRKLGRLRDRHPDLAGVYDAKLDDVRRWRAATADRNEVAAIRARLEAVLDRVEEQLGTTRHLAGDTYSVADVAWTCVLADGRTPPS